MQSETQWQSQGRGGDKKGTYLELLIQAQTRQVDFQINGTLLHHHPPFHFILGKFFLETTMREPRVIEIVLNRSGSKIVAILMKVLRNLASRLREIKRGPARRRFDIWRRPMVQEDLGDVLVSIGHCPH